MDIDTIEILDHNMQNFSAAMTWKNTQFIAEMNWDIFCGVKLWAERANTNERGRRQFGLRSPKYILLSG